MYVKSLEDVCCPKCRGRLDFEEENIPAILVDTVNGQEIREAFLSCLECKRDYPIIAGVAILVLDPLTYIANNYFTISNMVSGHISSKMYEYLLANSVDLVSNEGHRADSGSLQGLSTYIFAHYEDLASFLTDTHPLYSFIDNGYGDWYGRFLQLAKPYLASQPLALDIGCNVGGLSYRLAPLSRFVYGVDYSFCAVLTARRILLAQPTPQNTYRLHIEGNCYQEQSLDVKSSSNLEFVVADADNIPFDYKSFDIVTCANMIDVVPNPRNLLDEINLLLRDGGLLALTDPYYWGSASPIEQWMGGHPNEPSASKVREQIDQRFRILEDVDMVPWILRYYERHYRLYLNHHLIARNEVTPKN